MQLPSLLIGVAYGIFIAATDPERVSTMSNFNIEMTDEVMLLTLSMTLLVAIVVCIFARGFLKRNNESLGLTNTNKGKNYLKGLAIGFLMLSGSVLVLRILGMIELNLNLANVSH